MESVERINLLGLDGSALSELVGQWGGKPFRARQLQRWMHQRGADSFEASWPTNEPALSREQRIALQEGLARRGYDVGTADGIIGPRTVAAIKEFQKSAGLPVDGFPTVALLGRL